MEDVLLLTFVGVGGYFLMKNLFPTAGTTSNNTATAATNQQATDTSIQQLASSGITPTLSAAQAANIANLVFQLGLPDETDYASMIGALEQIKNNADFLSVQKAFGTRKMNTNGALSLCAVLSMNCTDIDFTSFVRLILSRDLSGESLEDINSYLWSQGVTYQF